METTVSYCGIVCSGCPVFWATRETDPDLKQKIKAEIARYSNELYSTEYSWQDINDCYGCMDPEDRLFRGCENCAIRNCARERGHLNCAYCGDYTCEKLDPIFDESTDSKIRLDFIRRVIGPAGKSN